MQTVGEMCGPEKAAHHTSRARLWLPADEWFAAVIRRSAGRRGTGFSREDMSTD
jgi:hypothetical protein